MFSEESALQDSAELINIFQKYSLICSALKPDTQS